MDDERYGQAVRGVTQFWAWTVPALFLVLMLLGLMMRSNQAGIINVDADYFASSAESVGERRFWQLAKTMI